MTVTTNFFERPRFRPQVAISTEGDAALVRLRDQEAEVELRAETRDEAVRLLALLVEGGRTQAELEAACPALANEVGTVLRDLDRCGYLTESGTERVGATSGAQFYRELTRYLTRLRMRCAVQPFFHGLLDGTVSCRQLVGYALEYWHVVHLCPSLLAPALAQVEPPRTRRALREFFAVELMHDEMLARVLASVDVSGDQLELMQPLPFTFAVCSSLGVYARQHPLSFKAVLFLFEEANPRFHEAFVQRCQQLGLPSSFYGPICEHASINDEGHHGEISRSLLNDVVAVSPEEQRVVRRHAALMVESLVKMERQILDYYGDPRNPVPRCFE